MYAMNSGGKIDAEQAGIRRLVGKTPDSAKTKIDRPSCQLPRFQVVPVPQHDNAVEGQTRFRAIPVDKLTDGVTVATLGLYAGQTVENG